MIFPSAKTIRIGFPLSCEWSSTVTCLSFHFALTNTMKSIATKSGDAVTVFVPSSPTPFTGYTITVPRAEAVELPLTVEEAIRFAVTGGVLIPKQEIIEQAADVPTADQEATPEPAKAARRARRRPPLKESESKHDAG